MLSGLIKKENETVLLVKRRHWWIIVRKFLFFVILFVLPFTIYLVLINFYPWFWFNLILITSKYVLLIIGVSSYYLLLWLFLFYLWVDYYLDVWVITDKKIVSVDQKGLFHRVISDIELERVQDVTSEVKGVLPTLFHYGNVYIQSAGTKERFVFKQIHRPYAVVKDIMRLAKK